MFCAAMFTSDGFLNFVQGLWRHFEREGDGGRLWDFEKFSRPTELFVDTG